jgi:hypothetical protein
MGREFAKTRKERVEPLLFYAFVGAKMGTKIKFWVVFDDFKQKCVVQSKQREVEKMCNKHKNRGKTPVFSGVGGDNWIQYKPYMLVKWW